MPKMPKVPKMPKINVFCLFEELNLDSIQLLYFRQFSAI
jgi:hypothetical protein